MIQLSTVAASVAALALCLDPALGQSGEKGKTGETIVTARKVEEVLEDVPASVSVITGEELEAAGIDNVRDAAILVPNLTLTEFSSRRLSFPFLRGIGSGQGESAVVTYVDGVPQLTTGSTNLPLVDLDRIEIMRGPQGTLYGRNALGGVIHVISKRPTDTPVWDAELSVGDYDFQEYRLSYSGPIAADDVYLTFTGLQSMREGYTESTFTGDDIDDRDAFFGRTQLWFAPTDRSELRIGLYGERARDGGFVLENIDALEAEMHETDQDFPGVAERDIVAPSVHYEYFGDSVNFVSVTAFQDWDVLETSDFDFTAIDGIRRETNEEQQYFYQELRFSNMEAISVSERSDLSWLVGVSGFTADSERSAANDFRPDGEGIFFAPGGVGVDTSSGDFDSESGSLFGRVSVLVDEKLEFAGGLRYDYESTDADTDRTFEAGGVVIPTGSQDDDESFDELSPELAVGYHFTDDLLLYGRAAKAFKAGGFNLAAPTIDELAFGPEDLVSYEVGVKSSWLEDRLHIAAAIFFIDWEDMQLSLFDPAVGGYVDNAGESTSQGVELEVGAEVVENLILFGTAAYLDTEFDDFIDPFGADVSGNDLPFAPESSWSLGAQLNHDFSEKTSGYLRGEYAGIGTFYYDADNLESESYELVNLRAGVKKGDWRAELWIRNLLDEEYIPVAFRVDPPGSGFPPTFVGESGIPRTVGFSLGLSF